MDCYYYCYYYYINKIAWFHPFYYPKEYTENMPGYETKRNCWKCVKQARERVCTRKMDFMIWKTKVLVRFIWWIFAVTKKPRAEVEECSYCGIGIAVTIEYDEYIRNRGFNGWEWRPFWAIIGTSCSNQMLPGMQKWPDHRISNQYESFLALCPGMLYLKVMLKRI